MKLRDQMPELKGATKWLNSKPISKKKLIGKKPTFIHFWSISCSMCKKMMPKVNELCAEYKQDVNVISVHMPLSEKDKDLEAVKRTAAEHNITQPIFIDDQHILTDAFENEYVPAYYVFDASGKLRYRQSGRTGIKMLQKRINRILNE
ncbi:TlpA family protein disulfide reductase [Lentibacillus cibarius]|uniref:TlpA family protein disulfide reductase n=1 Tax=Lentibacillus cibarius TaxID=2583219 RepID=A0A549YK49_9BACI|nr:TlpA disulfide reductase family protein [Lentibacillus cibarius]TRM12247.1 TlpA family protein disulfide reductase [Lentibacillus cibarius]